MNSFQRVIKYCAMALAIMLAVGIITGIVSMIVAVVSLITGNINTSEDKKQVDFYNTFTEVRSIEIQSSAGDLNIKTGEAFRVEAENVTEDFEAKLKRDGKLVVSDKKNSIRFLWFHVNDIRNMNSKITVYLPANFIAEDAVISSGAGKVTIEGLNAQKLKISAGAGNMDGNNLKAEDVTIDGGVGSIQLTQVNFRDADIDCGVGNVNISGELYGKNKVDCGVGQVELFVQGNEADYNIDIDSGVGAVFLNGDRISKARHSSSKIDNTIEIDGGVGNVRIDFSDSE